MAAQSESDCAETVSQSLFQCQLGEQPDHLVPPRLLQDQGREDWPCSSLVVNPQCYFDTAEIFPELGQVFPKNRRPSVWVKDIGNGVVSPFWMDSRLCAQVEALRANRTSPQSIPLRNLRILKMAHILVPQDWRNTCAQAWSETLSRGAQEFAKNGFVPVRHLIHPFHISALRRHYRYLVRTKQIKLGDGQSSRRYAAHNEPIAGFFHRQLTHVVSALASETVKPSYVYFASYQEGAVLAKHVDREQCEFSITLCLDYAPEPEIATPWPLKLHAQNGEIEVFQAIGDGLLYRGRQIPHSRDVLPAGHTSSSIFFHYVQHDFAGPVQ